MTITDDELELLRHMLGINTPECARPMPYRNFYVAEPDDANMARLASLGMVSPMVSPTWIGGLMCWRCTEAGRAAAMASHRRIRWSKAKRLYSKFLGVRDVWPDLTFKVFLTDPEFAQVRKNA